MTFFDVFFYLSIFGGFLMAFSLGANDAANSMASAVGAKAITIRQAVFIAGIMNFIGAVFLGAHVTATISKGIVDPAVLADPKILTLGMFSTLLTAGTWVLLSTLTGFPVSSTHAIVGGLMGFGVVAGGAEAVQWGKLTEIFLSWIISPALGGLVAWIIYFMIKKTMLDRKDLFAAAKRYCPWWMGITGGIILVALIFETELGEKIEENWFLIALSTLFCILFMMEMGKNLINEYLDKLDKHANAVEQIFKRLQIVTSAYVSLSHGANDVANAFGPVTAIYLISKYHHLPAESEVPMMMLVIGGIGIAVGISVLGQKVIKTVGEGITKLNNTRGFSVDFSIASTVLLASRMGLPVSSTTVAVGAVTGVGLAQGKKNVQLGLLGKIVMMWILTVPIAGVTSCIFFLILRWLFA